MKVKIPKILKQKFEEDILSEKYHKQKNAKFIRIKTQKAVLIIPIRQYIKGLDNENEGIPFDIIEEREYLI